MKCPKCGKEIEYLMNTQTGTYEHYFERDGRYVSLGFDADGILNKYLCPECDEVLFNNEADASTFLSNIK